MWFRSLRGELSRVGVFRTPKVDVTGEFRGKIGETGARSLRRLRREYGANTEGAGFAEKAAKLCGASFLTPTGFTGAGTAPRLATIHPSHTRL